MLDKLGQQIVPGCYIVYPYLTGRSPSVRVAKVLEVMQRSIKVMGAYSDTQLLSRESELSYPSRTVVLRPDQVTQNYKNLLEEYVYTKDR